MFNPTNSLPDSGTYGDLLKRMTQLVQQDQVDSQILATLQRSFETELGKENVVLSSPERTRLFYDVTKAILTDVLGKLSGAE